MAAGGEVIARDQPQQQCCNLSNSSSPFTWEMLVVDETYTQLKKTFLPARKGRPPDPPNVTLTNRLLLQLQLLKDQGGRTGKQMAVWFERLFTDISYPSDRLSGVLARLTKEVSKRQNDGDDLSTFLATTVDFDFVSCALSRMGLRRAELTQEPRVSELLPDSGCVTHEVIVDLENFRSKERLPETFTLRWVKTLMGTTDNDTEQDLKSGIKQMMACYKSLRQCQNKKPVSGVRPSGSDMLSAFLATPFVVQRPTSSKPKAKPVTTSTTQQKQKECTECRENVHMKKKLAELQNQVQVLSESMKDLSEEKLNLLTEIAEMKNLKKRVTVQQQQLDECKPEKARKLRRTLAALRTKLRRYKTTKNKYEKLKRKLLLMKQKANTVQQSSERAVRRANERFRRLQKEYQELSDAVQGEPAEAVEHFVRLKEDQNNRYTDQVRKTVLELQSAGNVAADKCSDVIEVVSKQLFGVNITSKDLPCTQTNINIADEGHVLTKIHATEEMLQSEHFTLHTDGTSRGGKKIVGHQITLDSGATMSLGFNTVATEDASSLLELTTNILKEITDLYCDDRNEDPEHVFRSLLSKLTSVMTDRAATMKAFDEKLLLFLKSEIGETAVLNFLHCNAHFLLGLSRSCDDALKMREEELVAANGRLGRDREAKFQHFRKTETATSRVIRLTSDVTGPRGDDKNGVRAEWLAFCVEKEVRSRTTSYRSNRFNCFFESAASIIHHLHDLRQFFQQGYLGHSNLKTESVASDLRDDTLIDLVCAVAILYLRVTGPFFELLQSSVQYADFHKYVQTMEACCDRWREDAAEILQPDFPGVFSKEFQIQTDMETSVMAYVKAHFDSVKENLKFIMRELLIVTRRQLADFLEGGMFGAELPAHLMSHSVIALSRTCWARTCLESLILT